MELKLVVAGVGHVAAQIEIDSRGAQRRPANTERNSIGSREMTPSLEPVPEDGIAGQQVCILIDLLRESADEGLHAVEKVERWFQSKAADADVAGHHALAGHSFKETENVFAFPECVKKNGHCANVESVGAQPDQVRIEAAQFSEQNAHPLGFFWYFKAEQFLDGERITEIVGQRIKIIDAIGQRDNLVIKLGLTGLLDAGVQISNFGINANNDLAVNLQHQAQNAMGSRVLRAHVDDHVLVFGALCRLEDRHG